MRRDVMSWTSGKRGFVHAGAFALGLVLVTGQAGFAQHIMRPINSRFGGNRPVTLNNAYPFFANPNNPNALGNTGSLGVVGVGNQGGFGNVGGGFGNFGGGFGNFGGGFGN